MKRIYSLIVAGGLLAAGCDSYFNEDLYQNCLLYTSKDKGRVFVDCGCFYSVICLWNRFHSCRFCSFDIEKTGERHVRAEFL